VEAKPVVERMEAMVKKAWLAAWAGASWPMRTWMRVRAVERMRKMAKKALASRLL